MSTYIVRQAFLTFTVGQVVYSDADAAGRPAMSVITDAQVAGHTAALVSVSSSGGGTSTGGTSTTGTGTTGGTVPAGVYIVSATPNSDGSITFVDSTGASHTSSPATAGSLTTQQAQQLAATSNIVNSSGQVTAAVVGDVSSATVGGVTEAAIASSVGSHTSLLATHSTMLASHSTSLSTLGTQASAATGSISALGTSVGTLSSQVGTLQTQINNSSTGTIQAQVSSIGTTVTSLQGSVSTLGTTVAAASTSATNAVSTAGSASALASSLGTTVSAHTGSLTALGTLTASHSSSLSSLGTQATSLAGSVSSLGTQVAQAKPITGNTSANGTVTLQSTVNGTTTALTSFVAASPNFNGDLSSGNLTRAGSAKPIPFQDIVGAAVYDFASFDPQGRGSNIFGFVPATAANSSSATVVGNGDDATAAAVFAKILSDLLLCKEQFFNAKIVMRPGHYYKYQNWNWLVPLQSKYNCIYPPGGTMPCARLNLILDAQNVHIHDYSTDGVGGILMGGYDVLSYQRVIGKLTYRANAPIQYAIRRDAANGTDYNAFAASGNGGKNNVTGATIPAAQSTADGTATQFELYDVEVQDASPTLTALCGVMVGGAVFSFIDKFAHYSIPNLRSDGSSVCQLNSASICYFGFTVYASVSNNLCQYKQAVVDFRGYMESFQGTNFGGSNCDYTLLTNRALYDWRGGYSNTDPNFAHAVTGLAFIIDALAQIDNFKGNVNLVGVVRLTIKGGYYSLHGGAGSPDGTYTGDNGTNSAFNLLGCSEVYFNDTQIVGPGPTPNKTPAIRWGSWTPTNAEVSSPNGPPAGTYNSQHLTVRDCDFLGWGEDPNTPPIEVDAGTDLVRVLGSQWGSSAHDGLTIGMRLATPGNANVSYAGNLTAYSTGMNVTKNGVTTFVQGNSASGLPAGLGVCEDSASSYHCYAVGTGLPSIGATQGALINFNPVADPLGMCPGANAATNSGAIIIQRAGTYQITVYGASTNATVGDGINVTYYSKTTGNGPAVYVTANGTNFATTQTFTKACVAGEILYGEVGAGAHAITFSAFEMTVRMIDLPL